MIRSAKDTLGYTIHATDGEIGKVRDLFFDDKQWTIRYLVVDTGAWLSGRTVLISPASVTAADWEGRAVRVMLTREQVKNGPDINTELPISRRVEMEFHRYYGFPFYWGGGAVWGPGMTPGALAAAAVTSPVLEQEEQDTERSEDQEESHLRSVRVIDGFAIQARDGEIGRVTDFLFDDETFRINYMVIDTSNWWSGRKVIVPPTWVTDVDWAEKQVNVDLKRETIKDSPEFDLAALNRSAQLGD